MRRRWGRRLHDRHHPERCVGVGGDRNRLQHRHGGATAAAVDITGGTASSPASVDFTGTGQPETFALVELRSPVRQGDQYTSVDRCSDIADFDDDGVADQLKVAIYARVVGEETVMPGRRAHERWPD